MQGINGNSTGIKIDVDKFGDGPWIEKSGFCENGMCAICQSKMDQGIIKSCGCGCHK